MWLANRAFVNRSSFLQYELQSEKFFRAFRNKAEKKQTSRIIRLYISLENLTQVNTSTVILVARSNHFVPKKEELMENLVIVRTLFAIR